MYGLGGRWLFFSGTGRKATPEGPQPREIAEDSIGFNLDGRAATKVPRGCQDVVEEGGDSIMYPIVGHLLADSLTAEDMMAEGVDDLAAVGRVK